MRKLLAEEKKWFEHVVEHYPKGTRLGLDPRLLTACKSVFRQQPASRGGRYCGRQASRW